MARERLLKLLRKVRIKTQSTIYLLQRLIDRFHSQDSNNERVHFNLGMLAMDDRDSADAERWFRNAVALKEDFRSALFNLALLLADEQRPLEAAPFLNQLVRFHPDHVKGLILLGDIYINNIKDLDAAENVSTYIVNCRLNVGILFHVSCFTVLQKNLAAGPCEHPRSPQPLRGDGGAWKIGTCSAVSGACGGPSATAGLRASSLGDSKGSDKPNTT